MFERSLCLWWRQTKPNQTTDLTVLESVQDVKREPAALFYCPTFSSGRCFCFFPRLVRLLSQRLPLATCIKHCRRLHTCRPAHASLQPHLSSLQPLCGNWRFHKYQEVGSVLHWTQRFAFSASVVVCKGCSLLFFLLKVAVRSHWSRGSHVWPQLCAPWQSHCCLSEPVLELLGGFCISWSISPALT